MDKSPEIPESPKNPMFAPESVPLIPPRYRLQWEEAQQSHVLLYPEGMIKLSQTAAEILKRIDGRCSVGELVADLERAFPGADLRGDVLEFLEAGHASGWIQVRV